MGRLSSPPSRLNAAPYRVGLPPREASAERRAAAPWRRWYDTVRWKITRKRIFLRDHFTCQMCGHIEGDTSLLVCDHVKPHRGVAALFWDDANLQTLCKSPCHDMHKQALEQASRFQGGVWD
jgi:5-methylcytosine-specific restriction endonuclease McrA